MLKLHVDTDLGGDIDDLCALALVLGLPGVELAGLTTVAEHGGKRAGYARHALKLAGRADVNVAAGADASRHPYRPWPALPDEAAYWPEPIPPAPSPLGDALALLENSIGRGATVVAIGPYTNLALLEERSPGILRDAKLCLMGGYVYPPRPGYPQRGADSDYNVQSDVRSALRVFRSSSPTLVPLAVTVETALRRSDLPALRRAGPLAGLIARQAERYAADEKYEERYGRTCEGVPEDIINFQHDGLACAIALGWDEGVEVEEIPLRSEIEGGWVRQSIDRAGRLARVVTRVDGSRFNQFWLSSVAGGRDERRVDPGR